jgi:hypothetical protein
VEEQSPIPQADPRHSLSHSVDVLEAWQPEPGCLICGSRDNIVPARFFYGFHGRESKTEALRKTTTHRFRIAGDKTVQFCQACVDGWIRDRKAQRKKSLLRLLGGFLIWMLLLAAAIAADINFLIAIVFFSGVVLFFRSAFKIGRNNDALNVLSKRMGQVKFQDSLDKEAWNRVLAKLGGWDSITQPYSIWTQSQAVQISQVR